MPKKASNESLSHFDPRAKNKNEEKQEKHGNCSTLELISLMAHSSSAKKVCSIHLEVALKIRCPKQYFIQVRWLESCFLPHSLPSPSSVPSGVPCNQLAFDGEAVQRETQGTLT